MLCIQLAVEVENTDRSQVVSSEVPTATHMMSSTRS